MRKTVAVLAVAGLAAVACVPFAACGGDNAENLTSQENTENFTSQEVDKATFTTAFVKANFENVAFEGMLVTEAGTGDEYGKSAAKIKFVIEGAKEYMKTTTKYEGAAATAMGKAEVTLEAYYSVGATQSETTVYYKDGAGAWQTTAANMSYGYSMYQPSEILKDCLFDEDEYELFAFNKEKKGYYYEEDGYSSLLKFKDGKLYSIKAVEEINGGRGTVETSYVFTYGGQSLTLPL